MDINKLLKALDDESNEKLLNFTTSKLVEMNLNIIKELQLNDLNTMKMMKKLKGYKYVDEMSDLKYGTYIRWIPINNIDNIEIKTGAIFCETKITDNGVFLICKNLGYMSKYFQIKLDECLVFQKLTEQELVLVSALDHLAK
jgi:hypothetical protein